MYIEGTYCGIEVFVTESCGTFVARRKHKKRRIAKKWLKKYGKTFEPCRSLIIANLNGKNAFFCHPKYWDKLKKIMKLDKERQQCPINYPIANLNRQ